ncbi:MAG: BLUF domain-containing protein [Akkermansiaceae bacterium]|nr:BLUF domain-containing protein [Akkermansiaceae bacterium]MDP4647292.1 BLUF domain-containing protein [Akkermansiaceae bacterium]MDP4721567.1 BLUF domain-containing protein [Akkermansiaceae bacterium]MDP4781074.1 BLUF domain-containing protein [Akkermansiaceae bacterium]MDP4847509.1 BLUF domain-containing protein [Akkermansiaceae bacterium]
MADNLSGYSLLWECIQEKEEYPIFRITYLSRPAWPFTDTDLDDIESKSVAANNSRDVTGLLIVNGDRILQILEGRESAVRELYTKIEADARHTITKLVSAMEDEERLLLTWSMVVRRVSGIPRDALKEYEKLYDELLNSEEPREITIDHADLLRSISLFSALPS